MERVCSDLKRGQPSKNGQLFGPVARSRFSNDLQDQHGGRSSVLEGLGGLEKGQEPLR